MTVGTERTKPLHLLLGGWVAANGVLTGLLFVFHPLPISVALYSAAILVLTGFGVAVLSAARRGHVGAQRRMPVRGTSAALTAVGLLLVGLGLVYGWILSLVGLVPLGAAAWAVRRERIRPDAQPWPVASDGAPPANVATRPVAGTSAGTAAQVASESAPGHPVGVVKATGLAVLAARTVRALLRRRDGRR